MIPREFVAGASIRALIWRLTAVACIALAVTGALFTWSVERSREATFLVAHTQTILFELAGYTDQIVEAETGQRGYLLERQEAYLAPYDRVVAENAARYAQLKASITNKAELFMLARLGTILHEKLGELGLTIALSREGNRAGALAVVRQGSGRRLTVEFERLSAQIAESEMTALAVRQRISDKRDANFLGGVLIGGTVAMLVIIAVAGRTIARINGPLDELLLGIDALTSGDATRRVHVRSRDEIGKVAGAFNGMADHLAAANTARERVEAELRRSNQDLDQFAYSASHDLKAPLRGIRNLTQWITEDVAGDAKEETIENLALVQNRVERLEMLLDGLLRYSRVGQAGGETEDIDVARLISEITDYISPAAGFSVDGFGDVPMIRAHKAPLEQVLRNLIGNALKHHDRDAGKVTVRTRNLGDLVEFRVEDDGPGIPPNFHERIFGMFQTLRPRDELEGSGMGLAIVKKAVERNGGTVRVESAPPSRGTAFVFTWAKQPSPQPG